MSQPIEERKKHRKTYKKNNNKTQKKIYIKITV